MNLDLIIKEEYNKSFLSNKEQKIVEEILLLDENVSSVIDKLRKYGRKGLLTLGILLTVASSVEAKNIGSGKEVIESGVEYVDNFDKEDYYSVMIKILTDMTSDAMQNSNLDMAQGLKEVRNYYLNLRNNKKKDKKFSSQGEAAYKAFNEQISDLLEDNDLTPEIIDQYKDEGERLDFND